MDYKNVKKLHKILQEFLSEHGDKYEVNGHALRRMEQLCGIVDVLSGEYPDSSTDFQVSPGAEYSEVYMYTNDLIFEHGKSHPFFACIKAADILGFTNNGDNKVRLRLGVKDLWVRKHE